jgi:NDP-sugar pyrophosphorylase family protein
MMMSNAQYLSINAAVLAGGTEGIESIGKLLPMPLLPIPSKNGKTEPVINTNVNKLLALNNIDNIYVVVNKQDENIFKRWKDLYYEKVNIEIVIESPPLSS